MSGTTIEIEYTPGSPLRAPWTLVGDQLRDIRRSRELAWRLLVRNISARYRQTALGYFWAVFPMLATTAIWVLLAQRQILNASQTSVPFPLFLLTGMMIWQTFVDAIQTPMRVVSESKDMLAKINFPREALPLAALGEVLFNALIRCGILALAFAYFATLPASTAVLAPLGLIAVIALGSVLGMLLVPLGVLYQDVAQSLLFVTQVWMLLTPVLYLPAEDGPLKTFNALNPISPLVIVSRDWLLVGHTEYLTSFLVVAVLTTLTTIFGFILYRVAMPILIERMPS